MSQDIPVPMVKRRRPKPKLRVVSTTRYLVTERYWLDLRSGEAMYRGHVREVTTDYMNTLAMKRALVARNKNRARMGQCRIAVCKDSLIILENDSQFGFVTLARMYVES